MNTCRHCATPLPPSRTAFCSRPCNDAWKLERVPSICVQCGDEFLAVRGKLAKGHNRYCSVTCRSTYWKANGLFAGANNPSWRGGVSRNQTGRYKRQNRLTPIQRWAHDAVGYAIDTGRLSRCPCEVCGSAKAQAHHDDYRRPLDVRWLCITHHRAWHVQHGCAANTNAAIPGPDGVELETGVDPGSDGLDLT